MMRCSPEAFAKCPTSHLCGSLAEATFAEGSECDAFNNKIHNIQTNADRIRSMSDEELAAFMNNHNVCDTRTGDQCKFYFLADCKECVLDWLRQPAEEVQSNA